MWPAMAARWHQWQEQTARLELSRESMPEVAGAGHLPRWDAVAYQGA